MTRLGLCFLGLLILFLFPAAIGQSEVSISSYADYRILYQKIGGEFFDPKTQEPWVQILYKFHCILESCEAKFVPAGAVIVRFEDEEGIALSSDILEQNSLIHGEYYGFLWFSKEHFKRLKAVQAYSLKTREQLRYAFIDKKVIQNRLTRLFERVGEPSNLLVPVIRGGLQFKPTFEDGEEGDLLARIQAFVQAAAPPVEPIQQSEPAKNLLETTQDKTPSSEIYQKSFERITNEDIQKALGELEKASTETIQESTPVAA